MSDDESKTLTVLQHLQLRHRDQQLLLIQHTEPVDVKAQATVPLVCLITQNEQLYLM